MSDTVRGFDQDFSLEDGIWIHDVAAVEASIRVIHTA
jgi:hypothetical protein